MSKLREAAQQALEALEMLAKYENPQTKIQVRKKDGSPIVTMYPHKVASDAAAALRAALAEPEQEPVAWMVYTLDGQSVYVTDNPVDFTDQNMALPLYTEPPKREWVGLTDVQQEMEATITRTEKGLILHVGWDDIPAGSKLYLHPPKREWVGLTNQELSNLYCKAGLNAYYQPDNVIQYEYDRRLESYARAIEAKLKEKNHV